MSEIITHTAIFEDSARLALNSQSICGAFKVAVERHWDIAALGCLTRGGDKYPVQLLEYCRDGWAKRREGDFLEEKLAFVIGWRTHNAADRHFKPTYRRLQPEYYKNETDADADEKNASDVRIYQDLIVFREVYGLGKRGKSFSPLFLQDSVSGHPAAGAIAPVAAETALGGMIQRSLLQLQSFTAKQKNPETWEKQFDRRRQDYYIDIHRYARGIEAPDTDWLRRFILEDNFYDRRDPLIKIARALQDGSSHPEAAAFEEALAQAQKQSQYAQALRRSYLYILASSEFFERKIGEEDLRKRLDLGTRHFTPGAAAATGKNL